jgi:hypothetical protein
MEDMQDIFSSAANVTERQGMQQACQTQADRDTVYPVVLVSLW